MTATTLQRRISPQQFSGPDRGRLDKLAEEMNQQQAPAFLSAGAERIELPQAIYVVLRQIVNGLRDGRTMVLIPENETMTTQAAANYLGVSRPHLVELLERSEIPHHMVGTHRRVVFGDLAKYGERRDAERRRTLDSLSKRIKAEGHYDQPESKPGDES